MKKILLSILGLSLILYSCVDSPKERVNSPAIVINVDMEQKSIKQIKELFNEVRFIKLETNKESIFSEVGKLIIHGDGIYVLDKKTMKNIYVFNMNGNFLYKVLAKGEGPGELMEPVDFNIKNDQIYVLDRLLKKIAVYDLTGAFVDEKKVEARLLNFELLNDGNILALSEINGGDNENEKLTLLSLGEGEQLKNFSVAQNTRDGNLKLDNVFSLYNDGILYWQIFDNTVYTFQNGDVFERYKIDFGEYTIGPNILKLPLDVRLVKLNTNKKRYAGLLDNVIEDNVNLYFSFLHNGKTYNALFNKNTKELNTFLLVDNEKNIEIKKIFTKTDNFYVSVVYPMDLDKGNNLLQEIDNPMLILCRL